MSSAPVPAASAAPLPTDPAELQRAIEVRQARLAATVDELTTRVHPKELARRGSETAKVRVRERLVTAEMQARDALGTAKVRGREGYSVAEVEVRKAVLAPDGSPRVDRLAAAGAALLAVVTVVATVSRRRRRKR